MKNQSRTRRFCFFTGGSDSTLILHWMLELIAKNRNDELVVVLVVNNTLASGQHDRAQKALKQLTGNLVEKGVYANKGIMNRISIACVNQNIEVGGSVTVQGSDNKGVNFEFPINFVKQDLEFATSLKGLAIQETIVLSSIPHLISFLGNCRNKFYIGSCGSDIASNRLHKLKQLFELYFEIAVGEVQGDLESELSKSGINNYSRTGNKGFDKKCLPTLEFPVANLRKQDVIMALDDLKLTCYDIDKPENLLEHLATGENFALYTLTKIYHDYKLLHNHPDDYPSLRKFIKEEQLTFTKNGVLFTVPSEEIKTHIQRETMNIIGRATGMKGLGDMLASMNL